MKDLHSNGNHANGQRKTAALIIERKEGEAWERMRRMFDDAAKARISLNFDLHPEIITPEDIANGNPILSKINVLFASWGFPQFNAAQIERFLALEFVFYAAGSIKRFGLPLLAAGIPISTAKRANARVVADFCQAQILLAAKEYFLNVRQYKSPAAHAELILSVCDISGYNRTKVALIGCGVIARETIQRLDRMSFDIRVVDPYLTEAEALQLGVTSISLEDAFSKCKIVSNHLPDLPELSGILRYEYFATMPHGGTFINTGRGAQVLEDDLARALAERPDLTALLDVTHPEPPASGSPLYKLANVFISPHIAGCVGDESRFLVDEAISSAEKWLAGEELDNLESTHRYHITA